MNIKCSIAVAATLALGIASPANSQTLSGGSNFNWYQVDRVYNSVGQLTECVREPYGVIKNFHKVSHLVSAKLNEMRNAGQSRLRMMIFFGNGLSGGTIMDSAGGNLSQQHRDNLRDVLEMIRNKGFSEVVMVYGPQGANAPHNWSSWNQSMADENWSVIKNLHPIIRASGLTYRIDLGNEMMTTNSGNIRGQYIKHIWPKYWDMFHRYYYDSVGFSFAPGQIDAIDNMNSLYGNKFPVMADVHIYPYGNNTEYSLLSKAMTKFTQFGTTAGSYRFIIGEAYFNDATSAQQFKDKLDNSASNPYISKPWYVLQWPLVRSEASVCPDVSTDSASYNNYSSRGF
ncbi:hypothetical protein ACQQ2N_19775 [Dokdonella sp. MW10]|uniref:hypothetical protein n=1 Tax=Dokdonella sp. MW10 TaxID=2992926 RepID=UPI003F7DBA60